MIIAILIKLIRYSMNPEEIRTRESEMTENELADAEYDRDNAEAVGWWVGIPVSIALAQTEI